jgi:RNA polymerase sigma-70 factor, ECF subfamily
MRQRDGSRPPAATNSADEPARRAVAIVKAQPKAAVEGGGRADPSVSERDLLERLRRGEAGAAQEFYQRYAPRIYRFIFQMLRGGEQDAEDVLQETFMALAEAIPFFRGESSLFTFACAIAHRKTLSFIRGNSRRARLRQELHSELRANPAGAGGADEEVRAAMAALAPEHREVLFLKYVEEVSVADMARVLRLSEHAMESRLARARRAIRKILEAIR